MGAGARTPARIGVMNIPLLTCLAVVAAAALTPAARAETAALQPCRLKGVEHEALCGHVVRPLDPAAPAGRTIEVHFAVLPALARNKKPDPVVFFAGGPGQSAITLAGPMSRQLARFTNRRDVVLIDQRGTGRSAPLVCEADEPTRPLRETADPEFQFAELKRCREALQKLPHGDLRQYTTTIAMADADAVRRALGAEQVNLMGGSYGTRAVLEYLRQFPQAVRRAVIDGVAPPDMVLPVSFSTDAQASFDALLAACEAEAGCRGRYPQLRAQWAALLASLPRSVTVPHPVTGRDETLTVTRDMVTSLVRMPLYVPALASALPFAVSEAAQGRFVPLAGVAGAMNSGRDSAMRLAMGMHFSVVCAEDWPRVAAATDKPGPDFGGSFTDLYRRVCDGWPRGAVPAEFYRMPVAPAPVLVLSGGIDPVTPPRHGERAAKALGAKARHIVVPNAGHGVMPIGCMRDVLFRFIDAADDDAALKVDAACAQAIPRPPAFSPVAPAVAAASAAGGTR
jgi:pimeloyl-ACP methyl ester carboxylesterase